MKTGRNDPCPCGSGKKYKQCCLQAGNTDSNTPDELAWRRVRRALEGGPSRMLRFAAEVYGADGLDEAWREFMLWDDEQSAYEAGTRHDPIFLPWLLHCWSPHPGATAVADTALHDVPLTQLYLQRKGHQLDSVLREYLQSCLMQPFSFYEVEHCRPGHGFTLRDLLTGATHEVCERAASQSVQRHDVIYGQLATANAVTLMEATSSMVIPPEAKTAIIELRKRVRQRAEIERGRDNLELRREDLIIWELEVRQLYLELSEQLLNPPAPSLRTSDGEMLEFHTLIFDIDSAQTTFDALKHLNMRDTDPQMLEAGAERDSEGSLQRVQFDWVRPDQGVDAATGTVLGTIVIDGNRLTARVNSRERADFFRATVSDTLPDHAVFRADQVQTTAQMMDEVEPQPASQQPMMQDDPQAQALLADYLQRHYDTWTDIALPALGGRTPRQAVQDADGREQVEALLQHAERTDLQLPKAALGTIFRNVRERLGLD